MSLTDFILGPDEVQLGRRIAGGTGGQIFLGKFGMQEVQYRVLNCVVYRVLICVIRRLR